MRLYWQAADNSVKLPCLDKAEIMSSWKDHEIRKKSYLNYTQFVSGVPRSQWFGPVSPSRPGRDTQNMTDPASENRFGWFLTGVAWYTLI